MRLWLKLSLAGLVVFIVAGAIALATLAVVRTPSTPENLLSRDEFRCLAVGESVRTVAYARSKRKTRQIARIQRLLAKADLLPLDNAKLRAEHGIVKSELVESNFLNDCAEAYYEPGSTQMRRKFAAEPPGLPDRDQAVEPLESGLTDVPERLRPHGFDERANLFLAEHAFAQGDHNEAMKIAKDQLEVQPSGLYADGFKLVLADIKLHSGDTGEALVLYRDVGKLRIGFEAHYARYRASEILRASGNESEAEALLDDVRKWADRGDRQALAQYLSGKEPRPPIAGR